MEKRQIREELRKGDPVEIEPNLYGRLNKENKTLELSDGRVLRVPKDDYKDYFPEGSSDLRRIEQKEEIGSQIERTPFGKALFQGGETSSALGFVKDLAERYINQPVQSLQVKPGQEKLSYAERLGENYLSNRGANLETSQEIDESNPYQSLAGKGLGLAADVALTRNMSATKAAPLLSLGSQKTDIFDNPKEAVENATIATALGYGTDKLVGGLSKVAGSRANRRSLRKNISELEEGNVIGQQRVNELNQQQKLGHQSNINQINAQNAADQQLFNTQVQQRDQILQGIPSRQQTINEQFKQNVMNNLQRVEQTLGNSSIDKGLLKVDGFVSDAIESTIRAGSKEGKEASNFLNSVFKGKDGKLTPSQMIRGFEAVEDKIASSTGDLRKILTEFKDYAAQVLPETLPNAITFSKFAPKIHNGVVRTIRKEVSGILQNFQVLGNTFERRLGDRYLHELEGSLTNQIESGLSNHSSDFIRSVNAGELKDTVYQMVRHDPKLKELEGLINSRYKKSVDYSRPFFDEFAGKIADNIEHQSAKYIPDINLQAVTKSGTIQRPMQGVLGEPQIIASPPEVAAPNLRQIPNAPTPNNFVPTPIPSMPAPQGMAERLGESLENYSPGNLLKSKGALDNPIAKLAGLKYLFGKAAAPIEAAVIGGPMALKGLTSPSAGGAISREAVRRGGAIGADALLAPNPQQLLQNLGTKTTNLPTNVSQVIQNMKMKYPSYHDGILETPEDRKAAVAEIEKNPYLSIEDKAVLQANINRGKPIE